MLVSSDLVAIEGLASANDNHGFRIEPYHGEHAEEVSCLFHHAVQSIQHKHYSKEQLQAWSALPRSKCFWDLRLRRTQAWLLLKNNSQDVNACDGNSTCVGFINLETHFFSRGYIDCLYVHPEFQGHGFASKLLECAENWAIQQKYLNLTVDASYLSKGIFLKHGFEVKFKSYQPKCGQMLVGFFMKKNLS